MPEGGSGREPDPQVAFTNVLAADAGETDESPGVAERAVTTARAGGHLPPHAERAVDSRPLSQRFTEPEE
ncbi:hypothetical protein [Sphaerisporangium corydalis]|uniref:Uncharacterized protein n=1 Tax=Sphaerisporangium corydalis TaxID=1441875 RepID=A0ABV9EA36_9ACTN|nr:hypothetical protein [Sphaerisporangium corydalis]